MNEHSEQSKIPHHPRIWWSRIKTKWPFLIWIGALALTLYFYNVGVDLTTFLGHVEALEVPVAPAEDGRIESIAVKLGDSVTSNQTIAAMNFSLIDAEIAVNEALAAENTSSATDRILSLYGGYQKAVSDAESQLSSEVMAQGEAKGELQATSTELARLRKLITDGVMTADNTIISRLITQEASLTETMRIYPASILAIQGRLAKAKTEFDSFKQWLGIQSNSEVTEALIDKIRQKVGSPSQQIALLQQRKGLYTLRASCSGVVAHVFQQPGNIVARGSPIATVMIASDRVIGFIAEIFAKDVAAGMEARIYPRTGENLNPITAAVEVVSPQIEALPITSAIGQSLRGRRVYLIMPAHHGLLPGETVDIQLVSRSDPWLHSLRQIGISLRPVFLLFSTKTEKAK